MVTVEGLDFGYENSAFRLRIPKLEVARGEKLAFTGPSGSGKTTLLHLLAGILSPGAGTVRVDETAISEQPERERRSFRIRTVGLVFQEFELLEHLSVLDNILLPYRLHGDLTLDPKATARARSLADTMGIGDLLRRPVTRLSQGEKQRAAVCRALVTGPSVLLADEPTGNLDPGNKDRVLERLFEQVETSNTTLVTVTHDHERLGGFDRVIDFKQFHAGETDV